MTGSIRLLLLLFAFSLLPLFGCGTLYFPTHQLESPETSGSQDRFGHLEIGGLSTGTDLLTAPNRVVPAPDPSTGVAADPYYLMSAPYPGYFMGMNLALIDRLDLSLRIQPYAPVTAHVKYQLLGQPETRTENGNFSISVAGGGGAMVGLNSGKMTFQYLFDAKVFLGIRFLTHHLVSAVGFFGLTGVSGIDSKSGSGFQGGGGIGYQLDIESIFIRTEFCVAAGSYKYNSTDARIFGFFPSAVAGLKL